MVLCSGCPGKLPWETHAIYSAPKCMHFALRPPVHHEQIHTNVLTEELTLRYYEILWDRSHFISTVPLLRVETWGQGNAEYLWSYALNMLLRGIHCSAPSKATVRLWCGLVGEHTYSHRPPRQFYRSECTSLCILSLKSTRNFKKFSVRNKQT